MGQNGFLTAALIGATLGLLERRPALAGICLGLLTYKPQFGLLFPFALIADRRWLTIAVAAAVALIWAALSWFAFGAASSAEFAHWLPITGQQILGEGHADFDRLQSVFGLIRAHGGGEPLAWTAQAAVVVTLAVAMVWLWRSRAPFDLKAAALAAAGLIATPYVYMYDLVALAVAVAFLLRYALDQGLLGSEVFGLGAAALILSFPYVKTQVGLGAVAIVFGIDRAARASQAAHPRYPPTLARRATAGLSPPTLLRSQGRASEGLSPPKRGARRRKRISAKAESGGPAGFLCWIAAGAGSWIAAGAGMSADENPDG